MRHVTLTMITLAAAAILASTAPAISASRPDPGCTGQETVTARLEQARFSRPPAQGVKFRTAKEAKAGLAKLRLPKDRFAEKTEQYVEGFATIVGNEKTGQIWAMAIRRGNWETAYASCGFKSQAFDFGGTNPIKGARGTAKITIRNMEVREKANFRVILTVAIWRDGDFVAKGTTELQGDGTYSVKTDPVDLAPGTTYHTSGHLTIIGSSGAGASIVIPDAQITFIGWSF